MAKKLTIGTVSKHANVGVETIRFYQREGLISEPPKPTSGFRVYPPDIIHRLKFIQRAKSLGFTLSEIAVLLKLKASDCTTIRELATQKLELVRAKIADLQAMEIALDSLVDRCVSSQPADHCPIIASLNKD